MSHYVARITIEKVDRVAIPTGGYMHGKAETKPGDRIVTEVATVVTKADDLTALVRKTQGHLAVELDVTMAVTTND